MFTEYKKMSKKQKKAFNDSQRGKWAVNPITKVVKSKKAYDRKQEKRVSY